MTTPPDSGDNGWREWSRYVLKELEHNRDISESLRKEISSMRTDFASQSMKINTELAALRVRAGLWGAAGASIPVLLMIAIQSLSP